MGASNSIGSKRYFVKDIVLKGEMKLANTRTKRSLTKFGIGVKKRLAELNMEQKELAQMLGVSESYLTDVLRGDKPGHKYMDSINEILGFSSKKDKQLKEVI